MNNPANVEKSFTEELDSIITSYAELQVTCMLLQHEGCNKIRNNDSESGLIILEAVRKMRASLEEQNQELLDSISVEELDEAHQRTGFFRIIFSSISDAVIKDNTIYFELPQRPGDAAYKCDEMSCRAKVFGLSKEFFPSLYQSVA